MKKKNIAIATTFAFLTLSMVSVFSLNDKKANEANAYSTSSVPHNIDLNDSTENEIRNYYSGLSGLSESEKKGTNLLKNLKPILKNGQKYFSYGSSATTAVWQAYEIVDRDWVKSPASSISGYNAKTNTITGYVYGSSVNGDRGTNPYVHALYVNRNVDNQTTAWSDHQQDQWGINQEHIWAKSCGFENNSPSTGARGDLMHLWAGNGRVNGDTHSNYYYGYVDTTKSYNDAGTYASTLSGNRRGTSKSLGGSVTVFEPQDSDKGDIARAIFYMAARYNYISGSDSDGIDAGNPNLEIVNNVTSWTNSGYQSTTTTTGKMGILQDLLEWNRLDPPDEWEIHRNNLCYKNFTNNRNPFIDFPEWAEYIWGKSTNGSYNSNPTGYVDVSNDSINSFGDDTDSVAISKTSVTLSVGNTTTINAVSSDNSTITWTTSNSSVASISASSSNSGANITITANASGSATITAKATIGGVQHTDKCTITAQDQIVNVTSVSLSETSKTLVNGGHFALTATVLPNNATNKNITWTSSNANIATVENGTVTAKAVGNATITVTTEDGSKTATCTVTVINSGGTSDYTLYSGQLTEGDYVIVYNNKAMKNTVSNDRFGYEEVTPSNDVISNPSSSIVWHISQTNSYWTIYNTAVSKYAASTGTKNQGRLDSSISDYARWTVSGTSTYEFVNKANSAAGINSNLRNNGTYGFATYATGTGGALSLYKSSSSADPTSITASVDKTFYVGDTITKSDVSVIDDLGRDVNDFEFTSYTFTYEDAASGGNLTNKQFTATYDELSDTFTAQVARRAYHTPETTSKTFTGPEFVTAGVSTDKNNKTTGNVTVDEISFYVYKAYVYNSSTLSFSDSKTAASGYMYNVTAFGTGIASITVNDNNVTPVLRVKVNEADEWIEVDEDFDFYNDNYHYFKLDYDYFDGTTISTFTNISSIEVELKGSETALTTSDYLMYEDTNNQCVSKLSTATLIFENMTLSERNTFMISNDYVISKARERLNAWAVNQGKVINHINGDYILESASSSHTKLVELSKDTSTGIVIILISIVTIGSFGVFYLYRKRKE